MYTIFVRNAGEGSPMFDGVEWNCGRHSTEIKKLVCCGKDKRGDYCGNHKFHSFYIFSHYFKLLSNNFHTK